MNAWRIALVLGWILLVLAGLQLLPVAVSWVYRNGDSWAMVAGVWLTALAGGALVLAGRRRGRGELRVGEGYAIVVLGWLGTAFFGALPFHFSGEFPGFVDCFFESMSGVTTTGSSILPDPGALTHGVAFWRCFIQWIGGLGIVLFGLTLLPLAGVGGMHLFRAEGTGLSAEKFTPRLRSTAKALWSIYLALTLAETALLMACGLNLFEALCHAFTTMATGGFSTRTASAGAFGVPAQLTMTVFMLLAGVNFALYHRLLARGRSAWRSVLADDELRLYAGLYAAATLAVAVALVLQRERGVLDALQSAAFQVASLLTATGYASEDFALWPAFCHTLLLMVIIVGGMAGSTAGGLKVVRLKVLLSSVRASLRRELRPALVSVVRLGGRVLQEPVVSAVGAFAAVYLACALLGTLVLTAQGATVLEGFSASVTCLSNAGPGFERVGPAAHFGWLGDAGKGTLIVLMLAGRLEFFTLLAVFSRQAWKR